MEKSVGLIAILSACILLGLKLSNDLLQRVELLKEIHKSAIHIKSDLEYRAPPLEECFENRGKLFSKAYGYIIENRILPDEALKKSCEEMKELNGEDKSTILFLADNLIQENLESQLANVMLFIHCMEERIISAEKELVVKGRLYRSGGLLIGIGIVIFLL